MGAKRGESDEGGEPCGERARRAVSEDGKERGVVISRRGSSEEFPRHFLSRQRVLDNGRETIFRDDDHQKRYSTNVHYFDHTLNGPEAREVEEG